jgi:hypothetical protein
MQLLMWNFLQPVFPEVCILILFEQGVVPFRIPLTGEVITLGRMICSVETSIKLLLAYHSRYLNP